MKKYFLIIVTILIVGTNKFQAYAQSVGIGTSTFTPDPKSILELQGSGLGLLIPRMTWANKPTGLAAGQDGLVFYCTDAGIDGKGYYYWDGTALIWKKLFGGANNDYIKNQSSLQSSANFNIDGSGYIGGNVGIGTTSPGQKLDVNGRIRIVSSQSELYQSGNRLVVRSENIENVAQFAGYGLYLPLTGQSYNIYAAGNIQLGYSDVNPAIDFKSGDLRFTSNSGTERARITSVGNVGIGTSSPGQKLDVSGNINAAHLIQGTQLARPLAMWSAAGVSTGAVIIKLPGTVANYGMLHMQVDVYEYGAEGVTTYIIGGHNWNGQWYNYNCHTIGTSGKKIRLGVKDGQYAIIIGEQGSAWSYGHVVLSKITNGGYYAGTMDLGGAYTVLQDNNAESYSWITVDLNRTSLEGSGTINYVSKFTSPTSLGNSQIFDNGTNVGIGTTSPAIKFEVRSDGLGTWQGRMGLSNAASDKQVFFGNYANIAGVFAHNFALNAWADLYINTVSGLTGMVVKGDGNVGIGTTVPGFKLHVPSGYIGTDYINTTDNSIGSGVTGVMVKAGDNYHRTATSAALATFLGNYGNWIPNNGIGDWQIASSSTGTSYSESSLELRESNFTGNGSATPPRLGFHWGGIVASQIGIESSGRIAILNNPGSGYENLVANNIFSASNVYVGSFGGINSVPTTYGSLGLLQTKGGYYGLLFGQSTSNPNLMYDGSGNGGIYYENYGWLYYTLASNKNTGWGTSGPAYKMHVIGDIFADGGWLRTSGNAGWYSESYGGGWFMTDGTWIRSYNGKNILCDQTTQTRYLNWGENTPGSHSAYFSGYSEGWSVSDGHRFNPMNYDYGTVGYGYIGQSNRDWYYMYADYFTNTSDRNKKKDIVPVDENLYNIVMQDIDNITPAFYRYKGETTDWIEGYETKYKPQLTLGIMLDESPDYIQDNAFSGINIYSAAVLALAGVKYNREEIKKIKNDIITLQDFGSGSTSTWIPFDNDFSQNLNGITPNITITPTSPNSGFFVSNVTDQGFIVEANQSFTFNWLALAKTTKPLETKDNSYQIDQTLMGQLRISQNTKDKVHQYWKNVNQKSKDEYNTNLEGLKKTQPKTYQSIIDENLKNLNYLNKYSK